MKTHSASQETTVRREKHMTVVIIGGKNIHEESSSIMEWLTVLGYELVLVGVYGIAEKDESNSNTESSSKALKHCWKKLKHDPPDLVVLSSRSRDLYKRIIETVTPKTRILGPFALRAFRDLRKVSGQLGDTKSQLRSVELIKEVLMAGSEVSIMVIDEDFKVLDINNSILHRTRMSRDGCIGRTCHWVVNRRMEPCHFRGGGCPAREVLQTGKSTHGVREEEREDGTRRFFTVSAYPLGKNENGKAGILMVWKDVTQGLAPVLDKREKHIKDNFAQVLHQDKMTALGKLAAAAVHDINNPIQGILTFSKLMRASMEKGSLTDEEVERFKGYLDLIATESARCGKILKNLLSFARLAPLEKTHILLDQLLKEIELLLEKRIHVQGISLDYSACSALKKGIFADRNQIKQVFLNLLLNSIEALPDGGTILVSAENKDDGNTRIVIEDNGPGIPKTIQSSVFEPFVTTKEDGKGVGLGLSVVYGIIAQHRGTIKLQSEENHGTTFIINLPTYISSSISDIKCSCGMSEGGLE